MSIQRYDLIPAWFDGAVANSDHGKYVTYADHLAEVERVEEECREDSHGHYMDGAMVRNRSASLLGTMTGPEDLAAWEAWTARVKDSDAYRLMFLPEEVELVKPDEAWQSAAEAMRAACLLAVERFHHADCVEPDVCDWCAQLTFVVAALRGCKP